MSDENAYRPPNEVNDAASDAPPQPRTIVGRLAAALQIDRVLLYALGSRVWQAASGPITIALVIRGLTAPEQGIYYGLVSIVGIQAFFELGLLNVLISQAGHAKASLESGDPGGRQRLKQLTDSAMRWFAAAALLYCFAAFLTGWQTYRASDAPDGWQVPLATIIPLSAISVFLSPVLAILEGVGRREYVYGLRLVQMMLGSFAVWACLGSGLGLWALVIATLVQTVCLVVAAFELKAVRRELGLGEAGEPTDDSFRWTRDVLPAQWRLAVISAAYHFATQLFPLILLPFHGAVEAGRLGMTMTITTAIQMLSLSWVQTKYSVAARQHGRGDREAAGHMWRRTALVSSCVLVLGFLTLAIIIPMTGWIRPGLPMRFIEPEHLLWLGLGALANHGIALQSFYVLSRGGNPFLIASLIGTATVSAGVWGFGYAFGIEGITMAYGILTALVSLPVHTYAYLCYRADP